MKIGLVQCRSIPGNQEENFNTLNAFVHNATHQGCNVVCFSEYMLTGRPAECEPYQACYCKEAVLKATKELASELNIIILTGLVRLHKQAAYSSQLIATPNADSIFVDKLHPGLAEKHWLTSGRRLKARRLTKNVALGALICSDWHQPWCSFLLANQGVRLLFAPFATPHQPEKRLSLWRKFMGTRSYDCRAVIAACNYMGESGSGGGIAAWGPDGQEYLAYAGTDACLQTFSVPEKALTPKPTHQHNMAFKDFPSECNQDLITENLGVDFINTDLP